MNKSKVVEVFRRQKEISKRGLSSQYENTESCWSFYNADQMTYSDRIQFEDTWGRKRRAIVNFNKIQQNVDAVVGFMAQNRRQAKYIARVQTNQGQQLYSKNMNALYTYTRENTNADQLESDQDLDMMVNGYGAIDTDLSYVIGRATTMPNGEIVKERIDPACVYWDTKAKSHNLLDARWCGYWKDMDLKDALDLFQGSKESDFELTSDEEPSNTGYKFNPYGGIYDKIKMSDTVEWTSKETEQVRVYNHQWMEYETFYKAQNPLYFAAQTPEDALFMKARLDAIVATIEPVGDSLAGDSFEFVPSAEILTFDDSVRAKLVNEFGGLIQPIPFKRKVFYTAVMSGDHVFTWFKSVSQDGFSIKFKTGTWNRNRHIWMGMVNSMMEPQKYFNKALTELMFTIAVNSKGGVMIEEDAVEDIADFETKWAKTDAVIKVVSGALAQGKIQEKAKGAVPTGLEGIIQLADANIAANGVDPSFVGSVEKEDQSGILYKRRIRQAISKMARYFDSIELYQKEDARLCADLIPIWVQNNQGQWVRITGEDGADEFVQLTEDMLVPQYDVSIQEAALSSDQKAETAIILSQYSDKLLSVGDIESGKAFMVESLMDIQGLDGERRARLIETLKPKEQGIDPQMVAQMQAQLQELQAIVQSGQVQLTQSQTAKNLADAERIKADIKVTEAKVGNTQADTAKKLEEAQKIGIEAVVAATKPTDSVNVNV